MKIIIVLLLLVSTNANAWSLFGYDNYEDCVLEESKKTTNDQAARNVLIACRKKFPQKSFKDFLTEELKNENNDSDDVKKPRWKDLSPTPPRRGL